MLKELWKFSNPMSELSLFVKNSQLKSKMGQITCFGPYINELP